MESTYKYIDNLLGSIDVPEDGTLSRTVYSDDRVKAVIFGFDTGQELSEHKASMPAIIHILKGDAHITLGGDAYDAHEGTWIHMPADLVHSIHANTPTVMLLLMLKNAEGKGR